MLGDNRIDVNKGDKDGWTPLHIACHYGRIEVVRLLMSDSRIDLFAKTKSGSTALDMARQEGHTEMAYILKDEMIKRKQGKIKVFLLFYYHKV